MRLLKRVGRWLYDRLGLDVLAKHLFGHRVPAEVASRKGWMYVFGNATLAAFLIQVVTGVALATKYIPSPEHAYESLQYITDETFLGWFVRGMHFFGASAMIVLISLHMARVFLTGSYKFPRELNWMTGVVLLVLTYTMAVTGQLLRWDQNGIWTVVVATKFVARVPFIGEWLAQFVLGGDTVGGATLSRFFAFHVFLLPALIFLTIGVHVFLVFHHGISEPPRSGRRVDPETYREWYDSLKAEGVTYWPHSTWREAVFAVLVVAAVVTLAATVGPKGPWLPPDPTWITADPRPDWYARWYYALIWLKPRAADTFVMVYMPLIILALLLVLPLVARGGERSPARRPWAVATVGVVAAALGILTWLGARPYWVPQFTTQPVPAAALGVEDAAALEGSRVFYVRGCQYCHEVLGYGGAYGPALTDVTKRLSIEEITVRTVNGYRNMPAYRDILTAEELEVILAFLRAAGER